MSIAFHRVLLRALPLCLAASFLPHKLMGQAQVETPLQRQLARVDLGISGMGVLTGSTSGQNYANSKPTPVQAERLSTSSTNAVGGLITLRYTKSALLGAEFNYGFARYTTTFNPVSNGMQVAIGGVQASTQEFTLGYVAHGPALSSFGLKPYGSVGAGTTAFTPTQGGGQGLTKEARATYYYAVGVDAPLFNPHIALRAGIRQTFFLLPDFKSNFLEIKQRTNSFEPMAGIVLRF